MLLQDFITLPWRNRYLLLQFTRREVTSRYKGLFLGMIWSCLQPVLRMGIYYFIFGVIYKSRWSAEEGSSSLFPCILFLGIIMFDVCGAALARGPALVLERSVFVKKVIFPLEIFSWISLCSTLFYFLLTFVLWVLMAALFGALKPAGLWYIIPLIFSMTGYYLGLTWLLSAVTVFFRDVAAIMQLVSMLVLFTTPVFYPMSAIPENIRRFFYLNPMAFLVESARNVLIFAEKPEWRLYGVYTAIGWILAFLGFIFFRSCKRSFADCM